MILSVSAPETSHIYNGSSVKVFCAFRYNANRRCFKPHWHNQIELIHIIEGEIYIEIPSGTFKAKQGDVVIVPINDIVEQEDIPNTKAFYKMTIKEIKNLH